MRRFVPIALALILLVSFAAPAQAAGTFVRHLIRTSLWSTPSPDPTGIDFLPSGQLLVVDSEVDEMALNEGKNLWRIRRGGRVERTMSTYRFSHEPTDVAVDTRPDRNIWYFSDDVTGGGRIFVVALGPDHKYGTRDDKRRSFGTAGFGAADPEGLAFGGGSLWIGDGMSGVVYRIEPGPNGKIEGGADDTITSRNLMGLGVRDLEGVEYNPANGNLFVLGNRRNADILEVNWADGSLVKSFDLSLANLRTPSSIAYGPSSADRTKRSFYVVDRGVDNGVNPNENDGRIIELGVRSRPLNFIRNASFELDRNGDHRPDGWTVNAQFSRSNIAKHVGNFSGRHLGQESSYSVRQDLSDVVGGETYHFEGWTKIPTTDTFTYRMRILWFNGAGAQIGRSQLDVFTADTTWEQSSRNVTAPAGTVRGRIVMSVTGLTGRIYVDGFSLTVVT
jgi:hypothetical protein